MTEKREEWLDKIGATASWLCAIHCLILPLFATLLPLAGLSFLVDETTERVLIGFSAILAGLSLVPAYFRKHRNPSPLLFALGGIGLIAITHLTFEENYLVKLILLISGAALITTAHLKNRALCRSCKVC